MDNRIVPGIHPVMGTGKVTPSKNSIEETVIPIRGNSPVAGAGINPAADHEQTFEQLEKTIRAIQGPEKAFEISVHKETHAIMVKVFDKQTGDLIREIPSEKILDAAANLMELNGLIVDERA